MRACVFGGQFGSEGKGAMAEYIARKHREVRMEESVKLVVFGENSPNSGHTCSLGKTRNIPASSFWADYVILGPDSVIDLDVLEQDLATIGHAGNSPKVYVHAHAAVMSQMDRDAEKAVVALISSTGSGSGSARNRKMFWRQPQTVVHSAFTTESLSESTDYLSRLQDMGVSVVDSDQYMQLLTQMADHWLLFECSQGVMLDVNFGYYPYVTSRTTLPRVAIERNGLGMFDWQYFGVYRCHPIRTGGPSGPTGGRELDWQADLRVEPEIASVTKRVRRVFEFSLADFKRSVTLTRPDLVCFTHVDYVMKGMPGMDIISAFNSWRKMSLGPYTAHMVSDKPGNFIPFSK